MSDILLEQAIKKYRTEKMAQRRINTIDRHLKKNRLSLESLRRDERTQRRVTLNAKRDVLCQEKTRLEEVIRLLGVTNCRECGRETANSVTLHGQTVSKSTCGSCIAKEWDRK